LACGLTWFSSPSRVLGCSKQWCALRGGGSPYDLLIGACGLVLWLACGTPQIWAGYNKLPYVQKINFTEYPASSVRNEFSFLTTAGFDLLMGMLTYDPKQRISAEDALEHPSVLIPPAHTHTPRVRG